MPFPPKVKKEALVKSKRRCCVCHKYAGRHLYVHHLIPEAEGGTNALENAIVLCPGCHAEGGYCNSHHPIGTRYSRDELRNRRDEWWRLCSSGQFQTKKIDEEFLGKQHAVIFDRLYEDTRNLSRALHAKRRYNSMYGMQRHMELIVKYVAAFLACIEDNIGADADGKYYFDNHFKHMLEMYMEMDLCLLKDKLGSAFSDSIGSSYFDNVISEAESAIRKLYENLFIKIFFTSINKNIPVQS